MRLRGTKPQPALLLLVVLAAGCSSLDAQRADPTGQIKFGVEMARRGLWNEALFRFEQARASLPGDARVLNNLAVSYEAVGKFDEALATYKEAIAVSPGNADLRANYTKFVDFYQNYTAGKLPPDEGADAEKGKEGKRGGGAGAAR